MRTSLAVLFTLGLFATAHAQDKSSEADCKTAIDNMFKIEFSKDPNNASRLPALMTAAKDTSEYKTAVAECVKTFTPANTKCVINAKTPADIEACDKESDCNIAIGNMFRIEFLKVPGNADKLPALMTAAQATSEYKDSVAACVKSATKEEIQCIINAKSAADLEACDKDKK